MQRYYFFSIFAFRQKIISMKNNEYRKELWDSAGKAGLVLGLVSTAYMAVSQLLAKGTESTGMAVLVSLGALVLWVAKFWGCIALMKFFMKKYAARTGLTNSATFKFGMATAFLSALIYSAAYLAFVTVINPDIFAESLEAAQASYSSFLTADAMAELDNINFGAVTFFANLIYCFLFGTVLSSILSKNIPSRNPFDEFKKKPEDQ